jgi:hypothetical protein
VSQTSGVITADLRGTSLESRTWQATPTSRAWASGGIAIFLSGQALREGQALGHYRHSRIFVPERRLGIQRGA